MRDLIAHHCFAIDPDIIWEVAPRHVGGLLDEAERLREDFDIAGAAADAPDPEDPKST